MWETRKIFNRFCQTKSCRIPHIYMFAKIYVRLVTVNSDTVPCILWNLWIVVIFGSIFLQACIWIITRIISEWLFLLFKKIQQCVLYPRCIRKYVCTPKQLLVYQEYMCTNNTVNIVHNVMTLLVGLVTSSSITLSNTIIKLLS